MNEATLDDAKMQDAPGTFINISLDLIDESRTNPRKNFDPVALAELTENIRVHGVQQPVLVRPHPLNEISNVVRYELVAGARRYRACIAANMLDIPAIVKDLTDAEALNLQMLENLHRADLHPVEEAEGYRVLMDQESGLTPEDIARLVGKTTPYVAQRLKLLDLELVAKQMFVDGNIELGHALVLARLTPKDQERAVRDFLLGASHRPKKDTTAAIYTERVKDRQGTGRFVSKRRLVDATVAQLKEWVESSVMLALKKVPWDLADPNLVPLAGPCTTCPKRTGANTALFADLTAEENVCLDRVCFGTKRAAFVTITQANAKAAGTLLLRLSMRSSHKKLPDPIGEKFVVREGQWVKAKKGSCPDTVRGVAVDDEKVGWGRPNPNLVKAGDLLTVCANQRCKVHKHQVDGTATAGAFQSRGIAAAAEERRREALVVREKPILRAVYDEAAQSITASNKLVRFLVAYECRVHYAGQILAAIGEKPAGKKELTPEQAVERLRALVFDADQETVDRIIFHLMAIPELQPHGYTLAQKGGLQREREKLWYVATAAGIDPEAVAKRAEKARDDAAKAAAVPAAPAKAATGARTATPAKKRAAKKAAAAKKAVAHGRKLPAKKGAKAK